MYYCILTPVIYRKVLQSYRKCEVLSTMKEITETRVPYRESFKKKLKSVNIPRSFNFQVIIVSKKLPLNDNSFFCNLN